MSMFLRPAFLFFVGSVCGWCMEVWFRRYISTANHGRKWINPNFCTGPHLPVYGSGLCILYLLVLLEDQSFLESPLWNKAVLFLAMAVCMTLIEYIAGVLALKVMKVRRWDYSNEWGNIQGIICLKFSGHFILTVLFRIT